jgi:hypothetical protein
LSALAIFIWFLWFDGFSLRWRRFDLWFQAEANRAKNHVHLRHGFDAENPMGFIALAKEHLAAITEQV